MNRAAFDCYRLVDRDWASGVTFDFEGLRRQIPAGAKRGGQRNRRSAIGEFEVNLGGNGIPVAANFVSFLADRLLEFVQRELAPLDRIAACRLLAKELKSGDCKKDEGQVNCFSHIWLTASFEAGGIIAGLKRVTTPCAATAMETR